MAVSDPSIFGSDPITMALAWVLTYSLHSTALLGGAWLLLRSYKGFSDNVRDGIWKLALVGGLVTATAQVGFGVRGFGGSLLMLTPETESAPELEQPAQLPLDRGMAELEPLEPVNSELVAPAPVRKSEVQSSPRANKRRSGSSVNAPRVPVVFPRQLVQQESAPVRQERQPRELQAPRQPNRALVARSNDTPSRDLPREVEQRPAQALAAESPESTQSEAAPKQPPLLAAETRANEFDAEPSAATGTTSVPASPWLLLPWVGGTVIGALAIVVALIRLRRALLQRTPLTEGPVAELFAELCRRSGSSRRTRLSTSADIAAPITFGVWRPEVCLPDRALSELDAEQQEAMLAHELAHAVRRDPMWQLISKALVLVFFFQPLNRLARKRILDLAEYLSDDWAVAHTGRELPLASCLTVVARWLVVGKKPLLAPGMADGSRLSSRVYRLLDRERSRSRRSGSQSSRVVLATTGLMAFAGFVPGITAAPLEAGLPITGAFDEFVEEELVRSDRAEPQVLGALHASTPNSSTTSVLLLTIESALQALDVQIDDLQIELDSIRTAIRGLKDVGDLDASVSLIETQLTRLRDQREVLAQELPRLVRSLESDPHPSESSVLHSNPRKLNR